MKKLGTFFVALTFVLSLSSLGLASGNHSGGHKTKGELVKISGAMYSVKDEHGKVSTFHVNGSTHKEGNIKEGATVVVESTKDGAGHALSMKEAK